MVLLSLYDGLHGYDRATYLSTGEHGVSKIVTGLSCPSRWSRHSEAVSAGRKHFKFVR